MYMYMYRIRVIFTGNNFANFKFSLNLQKLNSKKEAWHTRKDCCKVTLRFAKIYTSKNSQIFIPTK